MVLSAKIVAQSFTVDWLSKAPWVSINTTATYRRRGGSTGHTRGACRTNQMALTCSMMFCYHQLVCFQYMHSINFFIYKNTSSPSLFLIGNTSLHSWMPVVSGSEPPLQENPFSGSSSRPSQFSSPFRNTISSFNTTYHTAVLFWASKKYQIRKWHACLIQDSISSSEYSGIQFLRELYW